MGRFRLLNRRVISMKHRSYDEPLLVERLALLGREPKTAFAAYCAQCLLPFFHRYAVSAGADHASMERIVTATWQAASGADPGLQAMRAEAEALVPTEADGLWGVDHGFAQSATAAAAYAVRTWLSNDPQEAAWAARQLFECADFAAQHGLPMPPRLTASPPEHPRAIATDSGDPLGGSTGLLRALTGGAPGDVSATGVVALDVEAIVMVGEPVQTALRTIEHGLELVEAVPESWEALRAGANTRGRAWVEALFGAHG